MKINIHKMGQIKTMSILTLFIFFCTVNNGTFRSNSLIWWGSVALCCFSILLNCLSGNIKLNNYLMWMIPFCGVVSASVLWAYDIAYTVQVVTTLLIYGIILILISQIVETQCDVELIMKLFSASIVFEAVYVLNVVDLNTLGVSSRLGSDFNGEWNANDIGMGMGFGIYIMLYFLKKEERKSIKIIYILSMILCAIVIMLSGSRKSIFIIAFSTVMYIWIRSKRKMIMTIVLLIAVAFLFYLVMTNAMLYELIGVRIEELIEFALGKSRNDRSTLIRTLMITRGMDIFKQHPILGVGANNFKAISGFGLYSHNNYIELLSGIGLIGFTIYYAGYIYLIVNCIKRKEKITSFFAIGIISIMILEYGLVSYTSFTEQFMICIAFTVVRLNKSKNILNISEKDNLMWKKESNGLI